MLTRSVASQGASQGASSSPHRMASQRTFRAAQASLGEEQEAAQEEERERLFGILRRMMQKKLHAHPEVYAEAQAEMLISIMHALSDVNLRSGTPQSLRDVVLVRTAQLLEAMGESIPKEARPLPAPVVGKKDEK